MRHNPERAFGRMLDNEAVSRATSANVTNVAYFGRVVDIDDPENLNRIRVKIAGIDDGVETYNLPWCISSMPNYFFCIPQLNEAVIVFLMAPWNKKGLRVYYGPMTPGDFGEIQFDETMVEFDIASEQAD